MGSNFNKDVMFSSASNEWATPIAFFKRLDDEFHFTLDPCSTKENAKCDTFFTIEDDGLTQDWSGHIVFCNPPYGRELCNWVEKSYLEHKNNGTTVVMLIPARPDTSYWHKWILGHSQIRFVKGRLKFGDSNNSAPFPSAVIVFSNDHENTVVHTM